MGMTISKTELMCKNVLKNVDTFEARLISMTNRITLLENELRKLNTKVELCQKRHS